MGPGLFAWDFGMDKDFRLTDKLRLQFRSEFFNVLNHTVLNNPGTTFNSGSFGRITGAGSPRIVQIALKVYF